MSVRRNIALNDGKSILATSSHQIAQQPFPFSQLPRELRYEIYNLCLASKSRILIVLKKRPASEEHGSQIYNTESHLRLDSSRGRNSTIGTGLLLLNHSVYDEAISVLYGRNSFLFLGEFGWTVFFQFHDRLTEASRRHLRSLEFTFPDFDRGYLECRSSEAAEGGLAILKGSRHLKALTFEVYDDITDSKIMLLQKIRDCCPHGCQIELDIQKTNKSILGNLRPIRIGSSALTKMQEWNWKMSGALFETIDDRNC